MTSAQIKPGDTFTREQLKGMFGGGPQGGIIPSKTTPNILLYSDPPKGAAYGYQDGWLPEEDDQGPLFEYTGKGPEGDQTLDDRNGSVLHHAQANRALHLFIASGYVNGKRSGTKLHRYIGEFTLDDEPFVRRKALDENQHLRWVYVFRLRPAGEVDHRPEDVIPTASENNAEVMPVTQKRDKGTSKTRTAKTTSGHAAKPERNTKKKTTRKASDPIEIARREAELSDRFLAFLEGQGHTVRRFKIRIKGLPGVFWTDLYDETDNVLYESKGESNRDAVRMAIGQLQDYRRHIPPKDARLAVLLPEQPVNDLADLVESVNMSLAYEDGDKFAGWPLTP